MLSFSNRIRKIVIFISLVIVFITECEAIREEESNVTKLTTQMPVAVTSLIGKTFIEHGELLDVKIILNGSAPYLYCYKFCYNNDIIPSDICYSWLKTSKKEVSISPIYLHNVGNYTLLFFVENRVGFDSKRYTVRVNGAIREQKLPFAPIVSSILAVLILLTGVTLHLRLRKITFTETADFDFIGHGQEEEEWEYEQSFIQRVKYLFCHGNKEELEEYQYLIRKNSLPCSPNNTLR